MALIVSNSNNLRMFPFMYLIWGQHHQLAFVANVGFTH